MRRVSTIYILFSAFIAAAVLTFVSDAHFRTEAAASARQFASGAYQNLVRPLDLPVRPDAAGAPTLRFASIERGTLEETITVTGALQPVETVEVGAEVSGLIAKLFVDFNDKVHSGDPLAQIDPRTFQAKVDEARSTLDMANAEVRVEQAKLDRAKIDLQNARANKTILAAKLDSARAIRASAERNVERKLALRSREAAAPITVDDAQTDLVSKVALEREASTMVSLNTFSVDGATADVRRLEAELDQAKAAVPQKEAVLRAAEADLDRTIIRSPIDGVVVGRFVNKGQTLAVGLESRTTFTLAQNLDDMEIHARVDEADIGRIAAGQQATFTVDAFPDRHFSAVVRQVRKAPQVNQNVVTYTVVLATANPNGTLLPGMTALVKIIVNHQDDVLKVPLAALRFQPAGVPRTPVSNAATQFVWKRESGGALRQVAVVVGPSSSDQVVVKGGALVAGDQVVVGQTIRTSGREAFGIRFGS
jgi:HlyD family secretion protein